MNLASQDLMEKQCKVTPVRRENLACPELSRVRQEPLVSLVTLENLGTWVHLENKDLPATQEVLVTLVMQESLEKKAQAVPLVTMELTEHQELQEHKDLQDLQESLVLRERLEYLAKITI